MDLDFGAPAGLAYRHNWAAERQSDMYVHALKKQAMIDADNKAKLATDDLNFGSANNKWDMGKIKGFSEAKIKDYGKYLSENPDWSTNMGKRAIVKQMKNELLNNEHVARGMRVDSHYGNMVKFYGDPKNADFRDDPYMAQKMKEYQNYSETGSIDGKTEHGMEFTFEAPQEQVDVDGFLRKIANDAEHDGLQTFGMGGFKQYHTDANKINVAQAALDDAKMGKYVMSKWNNLSDKQQSQFKGRPDLYIASEINPWFKKETYHPGSHFKPGGSGAGSKDSGLHQAKLITDAFEPLTTELKDANGKRLGMAYNGWAMGNAKAIHNIQASPDDTYDFTETEFTTNNGKNFKKINLGIMKGGATGRTVGRGKYVASEHYIDMSKDQFESSFGDDAIDDGWFSDPAIKESDKSWVSIMEDPAGKADPKYRVKVYKQLVPNEAAIGIYGGVSHEKTRDAEEHSGYSIMVHPETGIEYRVNDKGEVIGRN